MLALDGFRLKILERTASIKSLKDSWDNWYRILDLHLPDNANGQQVFNFAHHLSDMFQSNAVGGRGQSQLSGGGAAWECLVEWYLNLVFWGTPVIAARQNKAHIPKVLFNALSVTISNNTTNSESDIVVFSVPNADGLASITLEDINELISRNTERTDLSVVQCKTNWNDNAQIPMLWDLIYNSSGFNRIPNVSVGVTGVNPNSFGSFSYAFVTVPTIKKLPKPNGVAVLRVKNLTGGNYWGKPTMPSIAASLNEYFGRNFSHHFIGGVAQHISRQISLHPNLIAKFKSLDFTQTLESF